MTAPWKRRERREASTVETGGVVTAVTSSDGVAVAQAAASLWERAFMAADGTELSADQMALVGRELFRSGDVVLYRRGGEWLMPYSWDVQGGVERRSWRYDLQLAAPSGDGNVKGVQADAVAHVRINRRTASPWKGRGPLQVANISNTLLRRIEDSLETEQRGPVGHILPIPSIDQADTLADQVARLDGAVVLGESTGGGWDTGSANRTRGAVDWTPSRIGPQPPQSQVTLRRDVAVTILAACGVPAGLVYQESETGAREAWRRFLWATISPFGKLLGDEMERVTGRPVSVDWSKLFASDLAGRARAYSQLVGSGMSNDDAARVCGF